MMKEDEGTEYGHLFNSEPGNAAKILNEKFSTGKGRIILQPNMSDELLLLSIKDAVRMSKGKPFLVVPSESS